MPEGPPPGRYRIVERGRRLVTIDTKTGEEFGLRPPTAAASMAAPSTSQTPAKPRSALNPIAPVSSGLATKSPGSDKVGRVIALVVVGFLFAVFAFMTGLWIAVVIILAIPQTRTPIVAALGQAIRKFINGGP